MQGEKKDLYEVLGLKKDATDAEIKKAYKKLARKLHPDLNPGNKRAEEAFKAVNEANEVLSDPEKRARYDEFGFAGLDPNFDPEAARQAARGGFRWETGGEPVDHGADRGAVRFAEGGDAEDFAEGIVHFRFSLSAAGTALGTSFSSLAATASTLSCCW